MPWSRQFNSGVTYAISAGNRNVSLDWADNPNATPTPYVGVTPAQIGPYALVAGAEDQRDDTRLLAGSQSSDYGSRLGVWSPGYNYSSATSTGDDYTIGTPSSGTSGASAFMAGVVALYLQGRTGMNDCGSHPLTGPASSTTGGAIATCPDRVNQFIMANSTIPNKLATTGDGAIGTGSPNRLLYTGNIPPTSNLNFNPIDNQRFFVWQHYVDFLAKDYDLSWPTTDHLKPKAPDENGLDWWTKEITGGTGHDSNCNAGVNDNNPCTLTWRKNTSRAFWVDQHGPLFTTSWGLQSGQNAEFVRLCYKIYLQRNVDPNGEGKGWLDDLTNNYGDPASAAGVLHLIEAFIVSPEYHQRFGAS